MDPFHGPSDDLAGAHGDDSPLPPDPYTLGKSSTKSVSTENEINRIDRMKKNRSLKAPPRRNPESIKDFGAAQRQHTGRPDFGTRETSNPNTTTDLQQPPTGSEWDPTRPFDENAKTWPLLENIRKSISFPGYLEGESRTITFSMCWDVERFLSEELGETREFGSVLTLNGTTKQAYAASCADYVRQFWPKFGIDVLEQFLPFTLQVIRGTSSRTEIGGGKLLITFSRTSFGDSSKIDAVGVTEDLVEFAQILAWVTAVFRCPIPDQLSSSALTFQETGDSQFRIEMDPLIMVIEERLCWCPMFEGMVIAQGFPTPDRSDELGVEMPFDLMVFLGRIWYPMECLDGYVLKGHSTILVPTRVRPGSCQWHFISNKDHKEKATLNTIKHSGCNLMTGVTLETLRTARAFIGWTSSVELHAGARTSGFESIRDSQSAYSRRHPGILREMTPSIGTSGLGFFSVNLGAKLVISKSVFGPVHREHILLEDMLLNSKDNSTVLWNSDTRCGWMVPELAAILTIVHVWASRQTDSEALLAKLPFAQQSSNDGGASYSAIRKQKRLQLRSEDEDGEDLMFMTQVKNVFAALESRKEEIITRDNTHTHSWFLSSKYLRGWELMDIAKSQPWFKEKRVTLDDTCGSWPSILEKRPEIVVLFCRGLADLITPTDDSDYCQTWKSIPRGHSYLAATTSNIINLDTRYQFANRFQKCTFDGKICPSRLQELPQKETRQSTLDSHIGAIIIGKTHSSLNKACSAVELSPNIENSTPTQKDNTRENYDKAATEYGKSVLRSMKANVTLEDPCSLPSRNNTVQVENGLEEIKG